MELDKLHRTWNTLGESDPLWAILSEPEKTGNRWNLDEFLKTGEEEIRGLMDYVGSLSVPPLKRGVALDFGCGVGRLTQALAHHFGECHGVDIAETMLERARAINRHGQRCTYHLNQVDNLQLFPSDTFDFVYSNIVLQHMPLEVSTSYLPEFVRVLKRGGLVVFQLPSRLASGPRAVQPLLHGGALPDSGYRAQLVILDAPATVAAGMPFTVRVRVVNRGDTTWPSWLDNSIHPIRLANHWAKDGGDMLAFTDGRAELPHRIAPGEAFELDLAVKAPATAGSCTLEVDLVHELIAWFKDRGSSTASVPIRVEGQPAEAVPPSSDRGIEMHAVPRERVIEILIGAGASIVDVQSDSWAGPEWESYRYCARKSPK
jgi:SAM-dependent methyltransferase